MGPHRADPRLNGRRGHPAPRVVRSGKRVGRRSSVADHCHDGSSFKFLEALIAPAPREIEMKPEREGTRP